jgi:hypothetical protein
MSAGEQEREGYAFVPAMKLGTEPWTVVPSTYGVYARSSTLVGFGFETPAEAVAVEDMARACRLELERQEAVRAAERAARDAAEQAAREADAA